MTDSAGNSQLAPVAAAAPGQATIVVPGGLKRGPAKITVLHGSTAVLTGAVTMASSAPGLYSMNADGAGVAAATAYRVTAAHQTVNEPVSACDSTAPRSCLPVPLSLGAAGDTLYVALRATGVRGATAVQCLVAGQSVPVLFAGPVASSAAWIKSAFRSPGVSRARAPRACTRWPTGCSRTW